MSFEESTRVRDPEYNAPGIETYAVKLRRDFQRQLEEATEGLGEVEYVVPETDMRVAERPDQFDDNDRPDVLDIIRRRTIKELARDAQFRSKLSRGIPWRGVMEALGKYMPADMDNRNDELYHLVKPTLDAIYGEGNWRTEKKPSKTQPGAMTTWVFAPDSEEQ